MTRDNNEIPAIFNPKRVRAPSVVVTNDSPNGSFAGGGFTNILHSSNPQISRSDSISQPNERNTDGNQNTNATTTMTMTMTTTTTTTAVAVTTAASANNNNTTTVTTSNTPLAIGNDVNSRKLAKCKDSCCSELAQKMYFGVCVTILVTASWVGATHCIKFLYVYQNSSQYSSVTSPSVISTHDNFFYGANFENDTNDIFQISATIPKMSSVTTNSGKRYTESEFNAPFFASWFCTNFVLLFYPIFLVGRLMTNNCNESPGEIFGNILRGFRDRGFTLGRFFNRCIVFCLLWLITTYLYMLSLRPLLATDAMSLFATNVASAYLLSWVILHEQFVGIRIVAVILCDTGIALLAYMDGITGSPTLGGVVLATISGAAYAVFKVMFRKVIGDPPVPMIAFAFTIIGLINLTLCWPIPLGLYLSGTEVMPMESLFWIDLLIASILMLMFHILTQFSAAVTYSMFVTLGLITSVPVSAALDIVLYGANFAGMKLAGVILIAIGFFLVMFPNNWPDYITRLLRNIILLGHSARWRNRRNGYHSSVQIMPIDYRTGYIRSHLRSPSGRVR
ncbi:putative thiamine transporter SLC35F3 isoform X2 [Contarinia nasturtii]|uniref:putative thiamine transporter SLC35F3 isoform X2 n=1 Tax=Contarinia nasturtii TaxID=265458 RepID=UPI0012D3977E|nr:putative thiamine transporter SLC35F3 isoform X2 [Contarinia nasturtii]